MRKLILMTLLAFSVEKAYNQWNNNPSINNQVTNTPEYENDLLSVSDGAHGSIIVYDNTTGIYAQKIDSAGVISWGSTSNPVVVCNNIYDFYFNSAIDDGAGGIYIAWEDYRDTTNISEIYIQHINSNGIALWPVNGIRVTKSPESIDYSASVCRDGSGGVIVGWNADNLVNNAQGYAQRYNSAGKPQWTANGVLVCTAPGFRAISHIDTDGASGAILFLIDTRDDPHGLDYNYLTHNNPDNINVYAQRLSDTGVPLWTRNGVVVCAAAGNQGSFNDNKVVSDGNGGAVFIYGDGRNDVPDKYGNPTNSDIYAQKLDKNGLVQWSVNGVRVTSAAGNQVTKASINDGSGGIVIAWDNEAENAVYTQRINGTGTVSWVDNGLAVATESTNVTAIADGAGRYIYSYRKYNGNKVVLIAQKLNVVGEFLWGTDGVTVSDTAVYIDSGPCIVLSNDTAVIISWVDNRNPNSDIFASKLLSTGILAGSSFAQFVSSANGNWNSPATWLGGIVPPANADVIIRHNVTVTVNTTCYSLKVESPAANLVIQSGIKLIIMHN